MFLSNSLDMMKNLHLYLIYIYYLNRLYGVRNKAVALGKKSKINKRRGGFISDSRVDAYVVWCRTWSKNLGQYLILLLYYYLLAWYSRIKKTIQMTKATNRQSPTIKVRTHNRSATLKWKKKKRDFSFKILAIFVEFFFKEFFTLRYWYIF